MSSNLQANPQAVFTSVVDALEPTDSAVPAIWNDVFQDLLNNDAALQRRLVQIETQGAVPDGGVSDAKIGPRTANPTLVPPAGTSSGTLTQWLGWLTNRLRAITGRPNWWESPRISLEDALRRQSDTGVGTLEFGDAGGLIMHPDPANADIVADGSTGALILRGGRQAGAGAEITLDGRNRYGVNQGGGIHLFTHGAGAVSINGFLALHTGNHTHRTDAQNDQRYVLKGESAGRTDAQNDLRYLRRDTSGTLAGSLTVQGTVSANTVELNRVRIGGTDLNVVHYLFTFDEILVPGANQYQDGSVRKDWHNGSRGWHMITFTLPNLPRAAALIHNLDDLFPDHIEYRLTRAGDRAFVTFFNYHEVAARTRHRSVRIIALGS